jgi:hypothetical protein
VEKSLILEDAAGDDGGGTLSLITVGGWGVADEGVVGTARSLPAREVEPLWGGFGMLRPVEEALTMLLELSSQVCSCACA